MLKRIKDKLKHHFHEVMRVRKSAHSIALGFAIGTFISVLPTPGFHLLMALVVILVFKKVNKLSMIGAIFFWNPVTLAPIYYLSYQIGDLLFGESVIVGYNLTIYDKIFNFSRRFLVGNIMLAVTITIASYFIVRKIVEIYSVRRILKESSGAHRHH